MIVQWSAVPCTFALSQKKTKKETKKSHIQGLVFQKVTPSVKLSGTILREYVAARTQKRLQKLIENICM